MREKPSLNPTSPADVTEQVSRRRPRRMWFSLRGLLVVLTLTAACFSIFIYQVERQRQAIAYVNKLSGIAGYDYTRLPDAVVRLLGHDRCMRVIAVHFGFRPVAIDLDRLSPLTHLQLLDLRHTMVADDDLKRLTMFPHLRELMLWSSQVTSSGIAHLERLDGLETLMISSSMLDEESLASLARCRRLKKLVVFDEVHASKSLRPHSLEGRWLARVRATLPNVEVLPSIEVHRPPLPPGAPLSMYSRPSYRVLGDGRGSSR